MFSDRQYRFDQGVALVGRGRAQFAHPDARLDNQRAREQIRWKSTGDQLYGD